MKVKVKVGEQRITVYNDDDSVMSIWNKQKIDDAGGVDKIIEIFKKRNPKLEVEMLGDAVAPAPAPAAEVKPVETEIKSV